jgi:hypothetical protein
VIASEIDADQAADLAALRADVRRQEAEQRQALQQARERAAEFDAALSDALQSLGLHRASRHHWRRKSGFEFMAEGSEIQKRKLHSCANLAYLAEFTLVKEAFGEVPEVQDDIMTRMAEMRRELEGPAPVSPALKLAAESAVYAWAQHYIAEFHVARTSASRDLLRHAAWAHRKYLQSLTTVEVIRRLSKNMPLVVIQTDNPSATEPARSVEADNRPRLVS